MTFAFVERSAVAIAIAAALAACGAAVPAPRVAVVRDAWRSPTSIEGVDAAGALAEGLGESGRVEARRSDAACDDDVECLRAAGVASRSERVAAPDLAALGTTVLLRVSIVGVEGATREQTVQRIVREASVERVHEVARGLGVELARGLAPPVRAPWYEEWWPWTIGGGVLVAAAAIVVAGVLVSSGQGPDITVVPP